MSDNSLLQDFITETGEHLEETERNLLRLEQQPDDVELLNTIFRSLHTIKGSSEYLGLEHIAELSHKLEGLLELMRRGERTANSSVIDLLMNCNDRIGLLVGELDKHQEEKSSIDDLISQLNEATEQTGRDIETPMDDDFDDDEHDEELYGIFVEQLKEGLSGLGRDTLRLQRADGDVSILENATDRLTTLRSSANYMGYDELKGVYEKWDMDVDRVIGLLNADSQVDLKAFVDETMAPYLEQVMAMFPKVQFDPVELLKEEKDDEPLLEDELQTDAGAETSSSDLDQSLLSDFITETAEHLEETERNLLRLEQEPGDAELLNKIFRSLHTIKGSSEYLGLEHIAELAHKLESVLDLMRKGEKSIDSKTIDLLMLCNDRVGVLVEELAQHQKEQSSVNDLMDLLNEAAQMADAQDDGSDDEFEEDEYDEELYGIFVEQLTDGILGLEEDALVLKSGGPDVEVLEKSAERLTILRSSSNYMGYDELKEVYEKWSQSLDQAIETLKAGEDINLADFVQKNMEVNIATVKELFPKVSFALDAKSAEEQQGADERSAEEELVHNAPDADDGDHGLLADFITETGEHLEETERNLLQLEKRPDDTSLLNEVFRSIHTIKGSSEYLGMARIAELAHKLESLLDLMRRGEYMADGKVIDLMMACHDRIEALANEIGSGQGEQSAIADLLSQLDDIGADAGQSDKPSETIEKIVIEDDSGTAYAEEYDRELFSIFMEQFNDGLQTLADASGRLLGDESLLDILKQCVDCLKTLRSSANYMEYDNLLAHYDAWLQKLEELIEKQHDGQETDVAALVEEVMTENVNKAKRFFTTLRPVSRATEKLSVPTTAVEPSETKKESVQVTKESVPLTGIKEEVKKEAPKEAEAPAKPETETEAPVTVSDVDEDFKSLSLDDLRESEKFVRPEPLPSADEEDGLLDKLASAFESRLGFSDIVVKQYYGENVENNLFSDNDAEIPPQESQNVIGETTETDYDIVDVDDVESLLFSGGNRPKKELKLPEPISARTTIRAESATPEGPARESGMRRSRYKMGQRQADKFRDRMIKQSIRVDASKIDVLMNQVGELVVSRSGFNQLHSEIKDLQLMLKQSQKLDNNEMQAIKAIANRINEATTSLGRVTSELQENVMKVRMLPIAQLFSRYPRQVHDLVRGTDKKVNLEIYGEDTELDKKVIEQLTDPLVHIIRNAVDHGIEETSERQRKGKDETGTIRMEAYPESNYVVIEISDDGRGVDTDQIRKRALEKEFLTADEAEAMSDEELLTLIMRPGFSTAEEVTHTSGRGVGMDVVKDNIEKLNGTIEILSSVGTGAKFQIKIPLTLAIIPALLVRVLDDIFTIPLSAVDETIRIHQQEISSIEGLEVYDLRGTTIPLIRLAETLNMGDGGKERVEQFVVVVNTGERQVGFVVDELKGRQEVVIKPLEDYLQEKSGFSGATILGDGNISLILDVYEMVQISLGRHVSRAKAVTS